MLSWLGPENHVLDMIRIGTTWRIRLNRPRAAAIAMRLMPNYFDQLLLLMLAVIQGDLRPISVQQGEEHCRGGGRGVRPGCPPRRSTDVQLVQTLSSTHRRPERLVQVLALRTRHGRRRHLCCRPWLRPLSPALLQGRSLASQPLKMWGSIHPVVNLGR